VVDSSAQQHPTIYVSAGRRGLEIELPASELAATLKAQFADIIDNDC
jgi:Cys-tRNA(Pro)/Cys-tRNA(Cys) deacylase